MIAYYANIVAAVAIVTSIGLQLAGEVRPATACLVVAIIIGIPLMIVRARRREPM